MVTILQEQSSHCGILSSFILISIWLLFAWNAWIDMKMFDMLSVLVNQFELQVEVTQGLVCLYNDQLAMTIF